ncbi:hypothetical protein [Nostoc sp. CMAA1605]|uniref:hypothetical protein n=1 Tax=Nostoc sp. CMAA1605 TaxID=2055159 RepID=UPI001F228A6D|nr:hypothetical protein [Nostoc sp. CMAA1605]MCF4967537.1 hypothetical protein [Nostoc sp. CMAA1605]
MKPDNVYQDLRVVIKRVTISSSDRVVKLTAPLVEMSQTVENATSYIQLFNTKQQVYFWQMSSAPTYLNILKKFTFIFPGMKQDKSCFIPKTQQVLCAFLI